MSNPTINLNSEVEIPLQEIVAKVCESIEGYTKSLGDISGTVARNPVDFHVDSESIVSVVHTEENVTFKLNSGSNLVIACDAVRTIAKHMLT